MKNAATLSKPVQLAAHRGWSFEIAKGRDSRERIRADWMLRTVRPNGTVTFQTGFSAPDKVREYFDNELHSLLFRKAAKSSTRRLRTQKVAA